MKSQFEKLRSQIYNSIEDLPIFNWWKIHETKKMIYLFVKEKDGKRKFTNDELRLLSFRWQKLYDQYLARYGFAESFIDNLEFEKEIALLKIEMYETQNFAMETTIEIKEYQLSQQKKRAQKKEKADFYENKAQIEKRIGFRIDVKTCSVVEFVSYGKVG
jgi:hypothetical protein